jgi:hypothetical protein
MRGIEYQKDARLGLLLLVSVAFVFAATSCRPASGSDGSEWEFSGDIGAVGDARTDAGRKEGAPIVQGIYSTELVIHRDECRPSLESLTSDSPPWPARQLAVNLAYSRKGVSPDWSVNMPIYHFRRGKARIDRRKIFVERVESPSKRPLLRDDTFDFIGTDYMGVAGERECVEKVGMNMGFVGIVVRSPTRETLEYTMNIRWKDWQSSCNLKESSPQNYEWRHEAIPRSSCRESYTLRYTLEEECPNWKSCRITNRQVEVDDERGVLRARSNPCQCESE